MTYVVQVYTKNHYEGTDYSFKVNDRNSIHACSKVGTPLIEAARMFKIFYQDNKDDIIFINSPKEERNNFTPKEMVLFLKYISSK